MGPLTPEMRGARLAGELLAIAAEDRRRAIQECVVWLAKHGGDFKPECLAGEMARDLLGDD